MAAGQRGGPEAGRALETLCRAYWYPLYAYARRRTEEAAEAEDLTQAFFAELLEKNYLAQAHPERGRFRAFLLTAFKHFLAKQWDKARAQKRGGQFQHRSLDLSDGPRRYHVEAVDPLTPEQIYDREWALTLLERVLQRLGDELTRAGKEHQFEQLKGFLVGDRSGRSYADAAEELGTSVDAIKMGVSRLRRRYRQLLRGEIAQTVVDPSEIDQEIQSLFDALEPSR